MAKFQEELNFAKELALKVGEEALLMQKNLSQIVEKNPKDLVTEADLATDLAIRSAISKKFPLHGMKTEEGEDVNSDSNYRWHIDPIDGTVNFACGIPLWGVSIGLEVDEKLVMGVVYFPFFKELFFATEATGAYCNVEKLSVSSNAVIDNAMVVNNGMNLGASLEAQAAYNKRWVEVLMKAAPVIGRSRNFGAAVYEGSLVARGKAEGYIVMGYKAWDLAAIATIVTAAGGKITSLDGSKFNLLNSDKGALLSNGLIHDELLSAINS